MELTISTEAMPSVLRITKKEGAFKCGSCGETAPFGVSLIGGSVGNYCIPCANSLASDIKKGIAFVVSQIQKNTKAPVSVMGAESPYDNLK